MGDQGGSDAISALAALIAPEGRLAKQCSFCYELRLHRARGYGALKAILEILAEEEGLTLTEISQRLQRTPGSTKDYLSWLEDVDLVTSRQKRYSFTDPLLRVWVRLHCRASAPTEDDVAREIHRYALPRLPMQPPARRNRRYADGRTAVGDYRDRLNCKNCEFTTRKFLTRSFGRSFSRATPRRLLLRFLLARPARLGQRPRRGRRPRPGTACDGRGRRCRPGGTRAAARRATAGIPAAPTCGRRRRAPAAADLADQRRELAGDERARLLDAAIQVDRRDQRLVAVGQQRLLAAAAGLLLAAPEQQVIAERQPLGLPRQRRRRHERRLDLRLLPLVELGKRVEQDVGDDEAEDRVAEELERLVVDHAAADVLVGARGVRHRVLEQAAIAEPVVDRLLQRVELVAQPDDLARLAARCDGSR